MRALKRVTSHGKTTFSLISSYICSPCLGILKGLDYFSNRFILDYRWLSEPLAFQELAIEFLVIFKNDVLSQEQCLGVVSLPTRSRDKFSAKNGLTDLSKHSRWKVLWDFDRRMKWEKKIIYVPKLNEQFGNETCD